MLHPLKFEDSRAVLLKPSIASAETSVLLLSHTALLMLPVGIQSATPFSNVTKSNVVEHNRPQRMAMIFHRASIVVTLASGFTDAPLILHVQ